MDHNERNRLDYETQQILAKHDRQREKERLGPIEEIAVLLFASAVVFALVAMLTVGFALVAMLIQSLGN